MRTIMGAFIWGCAFFLVINGLNIGNVMAEKKLTSYCEKRDFKKSTEPSGIKKTQIKKIVKTKKTKDKIFVIHKHNASHLHYDFRIEYNGVLKSWAVPKGMPKKVTEKHLAIQTEDHPYDYAQFEGVIPEGNYGAGTVKIWDSGTYENIKTKDGKLVPMKECLKLGTVEIFLTGKKVKGPYALIKTKLGGKSSWLLIKMKRQKVSHETKR